MTKLQNEMSLPIPTTDGAQLEKDLAEALSILREAVTPELTPWAPPWEKRAKKLLDSV